MLNPHYGLNQPFCSAHTPSREALSSSDTFITGQIVCLENGKARLASTPAEGIGAEFVFEPNKKNWSGTVPTIRGIFEASTDQYDTTSIIDRSLLVARAGVLSLANGNGSEDVYAIARAIGAPSGGVLRFETIKL